MDSDKLLKIGSVGTSAVMDVAQDALRAAGGIDPNSLYSRNLGHGTIYGNRHSIRNIFDNYGKMISSDIDAVYIASPNSMHVTQALAALKAGRHVLVEKPAALCRDDIIRLEKQASMTDRMFFECITTIFMPDYINMKKNLPLLGKINNVSLVYGQLSSRYGAYIRGDKPNVFEPAMSGGALNDLGVYCIHTAVDLFGVPQKVRYISEKGENGIDLSGVLKLGYEDFYCTVRCAKDRKLDSGCTITGENGRIEQKGPLNSFRNVGYDIRGIKIKAEKTDTDTNRMTYEFQAFRNAIVSDDKDFYARMCAQSEKVAYILEKSHLSDCLESDVNI